MGERTYDLTGKRFWMLVAEKYVGKGSYLCKCDCGNEKIVKTGKLNSGEVKSCGCMKAKDLTGKRFGRLTVIKKDHIHIVPSGGKYWKYLCKCDCGNEVSVLSNSLRNGAVVSCGCYRKERLHEKTFKNLSGGRYGRWLVLEEFKMENEKTYWLCQCDCGTRKYVRADQLLSGDSKSCGCLTVNSATTHGLSKKRIYQIWSHMIQRCENRNATSYKDYGERGISVNYEWHDFRKFYEWSIENGYADHLSIDRINVNGNYEPSNCRWVDSKTQANNRRNNHYVKINGIVHTLKQWSEISCVPYGTICQRIRNGWNEEAAIFTVVGSVKKYEA
nr:hypothetical protein [uncultured Blautia sp.]